MKIIVNKEDKVIVARGSICKTSPLYNAIEIEKDSYISPIDAFEIYEVDDSLVFTEGKHCYDGAKLYNNTNYIIPLKTDQERISELEIQNAQMQYALMMGGLI